MTSSTSPSSTDLATSSPGPLQSELGKTTIADRVVQKIVGLAAREVPGVYDLGGGAARTLSAIRERIPGSSQASGQGVAVDGDGRAVGSVAADDVLEALASVRRAETAA